MEFIHFLYYIFLGTISAVILGIFLLYWSFMFYAGKDAATDYLNKKEIPR